MQRSTPARIDSDGVRPRLALDRQPAMSDCSALACSHGLEVPWRGVSMNPFEELANSRPAMPAASASKNLR